MPPPTINLPAPRPALADYAVLTLEAERPIDFEVLRRLLREELYCGPGETDGQPGWSRMAQELMVVPPNTPPFQVDWFIQGRAIWVAGSVVAASRLDLYVGLVPQAGDRPTQREVSARAVPAVLRVVRRYRWKTFLNHRAASALQVQGELYSQHQPTGISLLQPKSFKSVLSDPKAVTTLATVVLTATGATIAAGFAVPVLLTNLLVGLLAWVAYLFLSWAGQWLARRTWGLAGWGNNDG